MGTRPSVPDCAPCQRRGDAALPFAFPMCLGNGLRTELHSNQVSSVVSWVFFVMFILLPVIAIGGKCVAIGFVYPAIAEDPVYSFPVGAEEEQEEEDHNRTRSRRSVAASKTCGIPNWVLDTITVVWGSLYAHRWTPRDSSMAIWCVLLFGLLHVVWLLTWILLLYDPCCQGLLCSRGRARAAKKGLAFEVSLTVPPRPTGAAGAQRAASGAAIDMTPATPAKRAQADPQGTVGASALPPSITEALEQLRASIALIEATLGLQGPPKPRSAGKTKIG